MAIEIRLLLLLPLFILFGVGFYSIGGLVLPGAVMSEMQTHGFTYGFGSWAGLWLGWSIWGPKN